MSECASAGSRNRFTVESNTGTEDLIKRIVDSNIKSTTHFGISSLTAVDVYTFAHRHNCD